MPQPDLPQVSGRDDFHHHNIKTNHSRQRVSISIIGLAELNPSPSVVDIEYKSEPFETKSDETVVHIDDPSC